MLKNFTKLVSPINSSHGSLRDKRLEISTHKARSHHCHLTQQKVRGQSQGSTQCAQDADPGLPAWDAQAHLSVEATSPPQRWVQRVWSISGADYQHLVTVHNV